jgi:Protein of unknown function (DUF3780)
VKTAVAGFGFEPSESQHHFLVRLSGRLEEPIYITEHFQLEPEMDKAAMSFALGREDQKIRVVLSRAKWAAIADEVRAEFNRRLKPLGSKPGQWNGSSVPVSRLFGKELVLLAWAIEDADPTLIPSAIQNWLGLRPEERWWLYTMTNGATGHAISGRNKGWRKAVRFALTENPVTIPQVEMPEDHFRLVNEAGDRVPDLPAARTVRYKGKRPKRQGAAP